MIKAVQFKRSVLLVLAILIALTLLSATLPARESEAVQDMPPLVILDAVERGRAAMRAQVEQCQTPRLPPFVALPPSGSFLLIDRWGAGLEVRAAFVGKAWRLCGVNPNCDWGCADALHR